VEHRLYEEYARIQEQHWWFQGRRAILTAELERHWGPGAVDRSILDVGCGTGPMLADLARFGEVTGVDDEPEAVEYARARGSFELHCAPADALPFADAQYDLLTLLDVIEHIDDDRAALVESRRVLKPGGTVLIMVPAYTWMWGRQDEIAHHKRRYTRPRLVSLLADSGFEVLRATYFNTLLFPPIAAIRLARRVIGDDAETSDFELSRPGPLNTLLARAFSFEARLLDRVRFPFGVSVLVIARRPAVGRG
jgi:ubiquinone/menaquinone biosynthesis C-methylase UbiE